MRSFEICPFSGFGWGHFWVSRSPCVQELSKRPNAPPGISGFVRSSFFHFAPINLCSLSTKMSISLNVPLVALEKLRSQSPQDTSLFLSTYCEPWMAQFVHIIFWLGIREMIILREIRFGCSLLEFACNFRLLTGCDGLFPPSLSTDHLRCNVFLQFPPNASNYSNLPYSYTWVRTYETFKPERMDWSHFGRQLYLIRKKFKVFLSIFPAAKFNMYHSPYQAV